MAADVVGDAARVLCRLSGRRPALPGPFFETLFAFFYEQGPRFQANLPALKRLSESVVAVAGARHAGLTHGTVAPAVVNPARSEELFAGAAGRDSGGYT